MNESFPRILYNCPKVDSMKALEAPNSAMTHIQKIAPGPPIAMAVATPARFPIKYCLWLFVFYSEVEFMIFEYGFHNIITNKFGEQMFSGTS